MRLHPAVILACLSLATLLALPTAADQATPPAPIFNIISLGNGRVLEAAPPRPLTLNAHVAQYIYQPGGLSIAYVGSEMHGDTEAFFVKFVGVKHGETTTLLRGGPGTIFQLEGWTGSARYLLVRQMGGLAPDGVTALEHFVCVDVGANLPQMHTVDLPQSAPEDSASPSWGYYVSWSPRHTRTLFVRMTSERTPRTNIGTERTALTLYDPGTNTLSAVMDGPSRDMRSWSWLDETHLLAVKHRPSPTGKALSSRYYLSHDLVSGKDTEITEAQVRAVPIDRDMEWDSVVLDATQTVSDSDTLTQISPKNPALVLEDDAHSTQDRQNVAAVDMHLLWVRRTGGSKRMSAIPVGMTPGKDDPLARWSPNGDQIAYIAHGDLIVTDLTERDARPEEKLALGLKLTCPEERVLASSNAKQIGLALMQYVQDYDEHYPPAENFHDGLFSYVKDENIFRFSGNNFVYHAPDDLVEAHIENPSATELGTYDTPCAHIVLYADGHVTATLKE